MWVRVEVGGKGGKVRRWGFARHFCSVIINVKIECRCLGPKQTCPVDPRAMLKKKHMGFEVGGPTMCAIVGTRGAELMAIKNPRVG